MVGFLAIHARRMGRKIFRASFAGAVSLGCVGLDQLLLIARKEGHVIDEDQSANMPSRRHLRSA
jgi:hypothetical protein